MANTLNPPPKPTTSDYDLPSYNSTEGIPLLPQNHHFSVLPLALPPNDSTAPEIRAYIESFLHENASKYNLEDTDIVRIASAWKYGTGIDMKSYDLVTWQGLFGPELGFALSQHVKQMMGTQQMDEWMGCTRFDKWVIGVCLGVIVLPLPLFGTGEAVLMFWAVFGVAALILLVGAAISLWFKVRYNARRREREASHALRASGDCNAMDRADASRMA